MTVDHTLQAHPVVRGQVLLVSTSTDRLPMSVQDEASLTGCWLSEVAVPYCVLVSRGYDVTLASVKGGEVPVDPLSATSGVEKEGAETAERVKRFLSCDAASQMMKASVPLDKVERLGAYRALFLAGGHGATVDFPTCQRLGGLVREALASGMLVAVLCHGSAIFASEEMGQLVRGRRLAVFSDAEEEQAGRQADVPFLLETRLRDLGAKVTTGEPFGAHVEQDGNLLSGQNPASAARLALSLADALDASSPAGAPVDLLSSPVATHPGSMTTSAVQEALGVPPPFTRTSAGAAEAAGTDIPAAAAERALGGGAGPAIPPAATTAEAVEPEVSGSHPGGVGVSTWTAGAGGGMELQQQLEAEEGRVKEPTLEDNLRENAMPNPGTNTDNTAQG